MGKSSVSCFLTHTVYRQTAAAAFPWCNHGSRRPGAEATAPLYTWADVLCLRHPCGGPWPP